MSLKMSNAFVAMIAAGMGALGTGVSLNTHRIKLTGGNNINNRSKYIPAGIKKNVQDNVLKRYRNKAA